MKYLFDGLTKNTLTLAKLYKYTKTDDEFMLYSPDYIPVENFDVSLLSNIECKRTDKKTSDSQISIKDFSKDDVKEIDGVLTYTKKVSDSRKMRSTLDFKKALDWCDVYVCMENPEERLNLCNDLEKERKSIEELFERIEIVTKMNKPIYLGTRFDSQFKELMENYDKCINELITKKELEEILKYKASFFCDRENRLTQLTMIVGVSGSSGKMSNTFKVMEDYSKIGEKVAIVCSEEIYPFFDTGKYLIYPFCRNFSDLTIDEEVLYLRCLIEKIIYETSCDRILIASQGAFGFPSTITNYTIDDVKPKGVLGNILLTAIGCDSAVVCGSWKALENVSKLINFIHLIGISIDSIFISPLNMENPSIQNICGIDFKVNSVGDDYSVLSNVIGFVMDYPDIPVICDYMEITNKIESFIKSDNFIDVYRSYEISRLIEKIKIAKDSFIKRSGNYCYKNCIGENFAKENYEKSSEFKAVLKKLEEFEL